MRSERRTGPTHSMRKNFKMQVRNRMCVDMMSQNQFHLVRSGSLHGVFVCIGFGSLASVGPVGITNSFNPLVLPDLELGFHKLDFQWHFRCAGDRYVFMKYRMRYRMRYHIVQYLQYIALQYRTVQCDISGTISQAISYVIIWNSVPVLYPDLSRLIPGYPGISRPLGYPFLTWDNFQKKSYPGISQKNFES